MRISVRSATESAFMCADVGDRVIAADQDVLDDLGLPSGSRGVA
jgi:hypothetical protein